MANYEVSIRKALRGQRDLIDRGEHCSADPRTLASLEVARGQQVRILRDDSHYALYTVSEVRQEEGSRDIVRMGKAGRRRLDTSRGFTGLLDSQVPHPSFTDSEAEESSEFVERLGDDGVNQGLIATAPHGGDIERYTDQQAERVASHLAREGVSSWRCKGWKQGGGAFERWHITSTDIHEGSFPLLGSVISRGFAHAVAFHGFEDADSAHDVLVGGAAPYSLKKEIEDAIKGVVGSDAKVRITQQHKKFGGESPRNIVNRLTASGANGVQLEQKFSVRERYGQAIADAVAEVYKSELR